MAKTKKNVDEVEGTAQVLEPMELKPISQKEALLALYETLKSLNIRSISDLENLIARAE